MRTDGSHGKPSKNLLDHSVDVRKLWLVLHSWQPVKSHNCINLFLGLDPGIGEEYYGQEEAHENSSRLKWGICNIQQI